jgi:hypothetical protein
VRSFVAKDSAVALVITLLMLSVITFLAIAFLSMTKRNRSAVSTTLDVATARSMSDAALARAQTEIIARMMAQTDILSYDYTASHNYISAAGFFQGNTSATNVNYDFINSVGPYSAQTDPGDWATNIGNLFYDPRPPVFVMTNANPALPSDFRFWVDINRNGRFETNGYQPLLDGNGYKVPLAGPPGPSAPPPYVTNFNDGEPEWIGVLKYPEYIHSPTNPFIGRYAFMALPIGKTLDLNFIHNFSKYALSRGALSQSMAWQSDGFIRDEGVGSWELNLAALLYNISPAMYLTNFNNDFYSYNPLSYTPSTGEAFYDASQFLAFRYGYNAALPQTLFNFFGNADLPAIGLSNIDEYGIYPAISYPFDYAGYPQMPTGYPWPGAYNLNMFYDVQDLFDTNKTGPYFASNLLWAVSRLDTTNRYTFQLLLDCIGTGSAPEYGVYVYSNNVISNTFVVSPVPTPGALPPPSLLRTKVNINYDNTAQIQAGPYSQTPAGPYGPFTPMPTNLTNWTPLGFFTNAADLLLRSQVFVYTNYVPVTNNNILVYVPSNYILATFGITNIPVYAANNPGIIYNEQVHRMLQLAANIYAAANPVYLAGANGSPPVPQPPVFRPQLGWSNYGSPNAVLYITGFVQVTNNAYAQIFNFIGNTNFFDATTNLTPSILLNDPNVWGIPWVVGAVKGLPAFDQYSYVDRIFFQRKLQFIRKPDPNNPGQYLTKLPLAYTNQYYEMSVSNICGMDAWNPYTSNFYGSKGQVWVVASNYVTVTINNNYKFRFTTNLSLQTNGPITSWPGYPQTGAFQTFMQSNFVTLPLSFFSESSNGFILANGQPYPSVDTNQTTYPTHYWTVSVTNHLFYALIDGPSGAGNVLDFVNLGPFGSTFNITSNLVSASPGDNEKFQANQDNWWIVTNATDPGTPQMSQGVLNQINDLLSGNPTFRDDIKGQDGGDPPTTSQFGPPPSAVIPPLFIGPYVNFADSNIWMACDPLVHYTLGDLTDPRYSQAGPELVSTTPYVNPPLSLSTGGVTTRYNNGIANNNKVFGDPGLTNANAWQFPTNLFPGVGWLGRVHRGTPWQTVYLKSDDPKSPPTSFQNWYTIWVNSPYTYPTNDWSLIDLFTAVPNDNAARGLLSVNQTNDAAWAAVFAGAIVMTNNAYGTPLNPTNDVFYMMDSADGINAMRTNHPNGLFHHIGDILQASSLTMAPPEALAEPVTDEMVERIPQQMLSLLKVGLPQFVIYSWGQSLKPKNLYSSGSGNLLNICTNYEITGEFLTRTVCHIVSDPGAAAPRIVIDNYNIEPGN